MTAKLFFQGYYIELFLGIFQAYKWSSKTTWISALNGLVASASLSNSSEKIAPEGLSYQF